MTYVESQSGTGPKSQNPFVGQWNANVLETVAKKDGQVVGRGMYEVSRDANTLTVSGDDMLIVFDRFS